VRLIGKRSRGDAGETLQPVSRREGHNGRFREELLDREFPFTHGRLYDADLDALVAERRDWSTC
jgi:hypothetical protein